MRQRLRKWLRRSNHAKASAAQRRVDSEDNLSGCSICRHGSLEYRSRNPPRSAEALLHLFELLRRDGHGGE
jgi:hypothetical protein